VRKLHSLVVYFLGLAQSCNKFAKSFAVTFMKVFLPNFKGELNESDAFLGELKCLFVVGLEEATERADGEAYFRNKHNTIMKDIR
jgi:hypothetical protein